MFKYGFLCDLFRLEAIFSSTFSPDLESTFHGFSCGEVSFLPVLWSWCTDRASFWMAAAAHRFLVLQFCHPGSLALLSSSPFPESVLPVSGLRCLQPPFAWSFFRWSLLWEQIHFSFGFELQSCLWVHLWGCRLVIFSQICVFLGEVSTLFFFLFVVPLSSSCRLSSPFWMRRICLMVVVFVGEVLLEL